MGDELMQHIAGMPLPTSPGVALHIVPWLDERTAALLCEISSQLALRHPEVVAAILFGSVARHDERPLTDSEPSDVDLMLLVQEQLPEERALAIHHTLGEPAHTFGYASRDIQPLLDV